MLIVDLIFSQNSSIRGTKGPEPRVCIIMGGGGGSGGAECGDGAASNVWTRLTRKWGAGTGHDRGQETDSRGSTWLVSIYSFPPFVP